VIFLTALDGEAARRKGMECGAAEYLTKPFDPDHLIASLERHGHPAKPAAAAGPDPNHNP
jgi:DNA-binding response OmpR family regulator